jgi:hypothetical protein
MSHPTDDAAFEPHQREAPPGSPAVIYPDVLAVGRDYLDQLRVHHVDLTVRFTRTGGGGYPTDLLLATTMARSYALVDGFISAFGSWNPIVAAPLDADRQSRPSRLHRPDGA